MVNPGHASLGCNTCRTRRVKCDEERPTCRRCLKAHRICLGYSSNTLERTAKRKRLNDEDTRPVEASGVPQNRGSEIPSQQDGDVAELAKVAEASALHFYCRNPLLFSALPRCPRREASGDLISYASTVLTRGFDGLRSEAQCAQRRRALLADYGELTRRLRIALDVPTSQSLASSVYLCCLYEMIVNIDTADKTWNIHLDGLLQILIKSSATSETDRPGFLAAVMVWHQDSSLPEALGNINVPDRKISTLLDLASLQLRNIAKNLRRLFLSPNSPRKIDVKKLLVQKQAISKHLSLTPRLLATSEADKSMREIRYKSLSIVSTKIFMELKNFLQSDGRYFSGFQHQTLQKAIRAKANEIYTSAKDILQRSAPQLSPEDGPHFRSREDTLQALALLWPLKCAHMALEGDVDLQTSIQDLLEMIGRQAAMPQASSNGNGRMILEEHEVVGRASSYIDILGGLIIANLAVT